MTKDFTTTNASELDGKKNAEILGATEEIIVHVNRDPSLQSEHYRIDLAGADKGEIIHQVKKDGREPENFKVELTKEAQEAVMKAAGLLKTLRENGNIQITDVDRKKAIEAVGNTLGAILAQSPNNIKSEKPIER